MAAKIRSRPDLTTLGAELDELLRKLYAQSGTTSTFEERAARYHPAQGLADHPGCL